MPDLTNAKGQHTGAVLGFLHILFKILDEEQADYLTVAFDVHAPTFRHEAYEAYKGTRKSMPEELREQVPLMKEVLRAMGIATCEGGHGCVSGLRRQRPAADRHRPDPYPDPQDPAGTDDSRRFLRGRCQAGIRGHAGPVHRCESPDGRYVRQYPGRSQGGRKDSHPADPGIRLRGRRIRQPGQDHKTGPEKESDRERGQGPDEPVPCHHKDGL